MGDITSVIAAKECTVGVGFKHPFPNNSGATAWENPILSVALGAGPCLKNHEVKAKVVPNARKSTKVNVKAPRTQVLNEIMIVANAQKPGQLGWAHAYKLVPFKDQ